MQDFLSSKDIESQLRFVAGKQLQWTEPEAIKDLVNDKYFTIRKEAVLPVHKLARFLKPTSSKELFKADPEIWRALRDKKMKAPNTLTDWENAQFVVIDNEVITIVSDESDIAVPKFLDALSDLPPEQFTVMYNYSDKQFEAIAYFNHNRDRHIVDGVIIDLNVPKRDLRIWDAQITLDEHSRVEKILPVPKTVVKGTLNEDLFEKMGSIGDTVSRADATSLIKYIQDDLETQVSVAEAFKYLRKAGLAIKGKDVDAELSAIKFAVQHRHLSRFLEKLEEANLQYSRIKRMYPVAKSSTFTLTTFEDIFEMYSQIASQMDNSKVKLAQLADLMNYTSSNKNHKKQVDQSNSATIVTE